MSHIDQNDIRAAVGSGLLSEAQAASLMALAHSRRGARENLAPGDEPFELFKGFNEIFIVIGLIILATGWAAVTGISMTEGLGGLVQKATMSSVIGAVVLWVLSEYFIRRRRMVAPAIALSILWTLNAGVGLSAEYSQVFMVAQGDYSSLPLAVALTTISIAIYWLRFRVPFAMALIALGVFTLALMLAANQSGSLTVMSDLFLLSASGPFAWVTLLVGVGVFAVAMLFDLSDPHRVTRRSAQGFWLHVVAAPALVNTIALSLLDNGTSSANLTLMAVLLAFALVAIIIDRRSFLIAAIGYSVTLAATVFDGDGAATTILVLGLFLVILGAFWARIRALLISPLSRVLPLDRLPPAH
ncbi:hypothetical protein [Phaeobacter inhibens]|uniref:hypothetical protein n=1 Tax=Phaeobacter inhibens TaxID=221822 RepID=UPI0003F6BF39|nr:hypothetical protein [Phaeobacter inhibens]AUQ60322.1 hypothetical protein PhaeoP30_03458 [Phaeobacter inhibens]AUQ64363.1 hypothetical protein PhaeoP51_03431 [Phaeobacter inhibens]AUQ84267.1 hypothetical protein PhaeoP57_03394 [Phaeobacter inhibens]AUQ92076.1 hypothetical protein PhaeoP24_03512 [Phaeobacter inhibens]AUR09582.1 hypothetical protein PhaeoP59_03454 [Phaeobacter inhibens]